MGFSPLNRPNTVATIARKGVTVFGPVQASIADYRRLAQPTAEFGNAKANSKEEPTSLLYVLMDLTPEPNTYYPLVGDEVTLSNNVSPAMDGNYVIKDLPRAYQSNQQAMDSYWCLPVRALAADRIYENPTNSKDKTGTITFV